MSAVRRPAVAGRFYPSDPQGCVKLLESIRAGGERKPSGAIVLPHAGWAFSGRTALDGCEALRGMQLDTVVVLGAVHVRDSNLASIYPEGTWETPFGGLRVDDALGAKLAASSRAVLDAGPHAREHSIEVELPLIQLVCGNVAILPVMVQPSEFAAEIGRAAARAAINLGRRVAFVASTDLTHYGPSFGFEPAGPGDAGIRWAKLVNDRRFIALLPRFDFDGVVPEAEAHRNSCGAGAVAATIAAAAELGLTRYEEFRHETSAEVLAARGERQLEDSVGYHSGAFY